VITDWNSNLETGNDQIDAQHRELLERFKHFSDACRNGKGKAEVAALYEFLEKYAVKHFGTEEALMGHHNYPYITTHRMEHQDFTTKLRHLKYEIDRDHITLPLIIETSENLLRWIINHIHKTDVQMAKFLKTCSTT